MGEYVNFAFILHFDGDEETLTQRIMERAKISGRVEDNPETLKKRFKHFEDEELPLIKRYAEMGKVKTIDVVKDVDKVYDVLKS